MKFDVIIGNPPYQLLSANGKKTKPIWQHFVKIAFDIVKPNGYVSLVHPAGYRNCGGAFSKTKDLLLSKDVQYLEIHDIKDGKTLFNATTRYDWYLAKNSKATNNTTVKFQDGSIEQYDLSTYPFIPNLPPSVFKHLLATDEPIDLIYDSSFYHTQNTNRMSRTKTDTHTLPVIDNVGKGDVPSNILYANEDVGHFKIPKVVFGVFTTSVFIDDGTHGMSEHCTAIGHGIAEEPNNLSSLKVALQHPKFLSAMEAFNVGSIGIIYNRKVMKLLKKDFWKDFI